MPDRIPNKPSGSNGFARFCQDVWEAIWGSGRLIAGPGVRISNTTRGRVVAVAGSVGAPGIQATNPPVERMEVRGFAFNYLTCRPAGGAVDGSNDIHVALQDELRNTIVAQTIDGEGWTYDGYDAGDQSRLAHYGDVEEPQVITPRFLVGDMVPVWKCKNSGVIDSSDGVHYEVLSVSVMDGGAGSGYSVDDVLTVDGGTGTEATLTVTAVSETGAIVSLTLTTPGSYTVKPTTPNMPTGGGGSGASVSLSMSTDLEYLCVTGREWAKKYTPPV